MLGRTVSEVQALPYEEILGWQEYFARRPYGWRDDNRASIIAMAMAGSKAIKPEKIFPSLKTIKGESLKDSGSIAEKFFHKFSDMMTESYLVEKLINAED